MADAITKGRGERTTRTDDYCTTVPGRREGERGGPPYRFRIHIFFEKKHRRACVCVLQSIRPDGQTTSYHPRNHCVIMARNTQRKKKKEKKITYTHIYIYTYMNVIDPSSYCTIRYGSRTLARELVVTTHKVRNETNE